MGWLIAVVGIVALSGPAHAQRLDDLESRSYEWTPEEPDRAGLNSDTWYFLGYQWATIGALYLAPESVSGWTEEQKEGYSLSIWWDNATHPHFDSDKFYLNYILHPYWGASYFVRAKERGYDDRTAFWYSAMLSAFYEFGAEALFERPSIQDLIVTPVAGSLLGKYFMNVRRDIRNRDDEMGYRRTRDKLLWAVTDPLGTLNQQFDKLFGRDTHVELQSFDARWLHQSQFDTRRSESDAEPVYGFQLRVSF
jgi:hypothetical protein